LANKRCSEAINGFYTPEKWSIAFTGRYEGATERCQDLKAARWILVPEVVLGGAIFQLVI
jgi:hypothetical protein